MSFGPQRRANRAKVAGDFAYPGILVRDGPHYKSHTVAPTIAPITQNPEFSITAFLIAPLVLEPSLLVLLSVPFGSVPLSTTVFVPLTFATLTKLLF